MSSDSDATPAYRGYRLQALYTLSRVLSQKADPLVFQPEGMEDLAVFEEKDRLLEIVQVKQRSSNLTLSALKPDKPNSFFYRVSSELDKDAAIKVTIVVFGSISPELQSAVEANGANRTKVADKVAAYGYLSQYKAKTVLQRATLTLIDEALLTASVHKTLRESLPGIDPDSSFELLTHWLYVCAENRTRITRRDVIDRMNRIGVFLAARTAHHLEWFTSIIPLRDELNGGDDVRQELANEFYQGVSTRYEHIVANLDVIRSERLAEISEAFRQNRIVIIHAASGQGKTTLAYRYLCDFFPSDWRFRIASLATREQTLRVALAVSKHAEAIGIPLVLYIDVSPRNLEWTELVRELANQRNIRVLVTVREEDWRRANFSGADLSFSGIDLTFDRREAEQIYDSLTSKITPTNVLDFEEAWIKFGEAGPLLEFIYLVTKGSSLHERLTQQISHLEAEVREGRLLPSELELLRLVSVASAYEARLQIAPLIQQLELSSPAATVRLFEKEYLLRVSDEGNLLDGLHPIRSTILSELLCDPVIVPWSQSSSKCLPFIHERDLETFLLHSFSRRNDELDPLVSALTSYQPKTWVAVIGCIRSQIWLGVAKYVAVNNQVIKDAAEQVGQGWAHFLDFDLAGSSPDQIARSWWRDLDVIPDEGKAIIANLQKRQTDKTEIFARVTEWLKTRTEPVNVPVDEHDWEASAEAIFWTTHLNVDWPLQTWMPEKSLDIALQSLSLFALANLIFALSMTHKFDEWLTRNRDQYVNRYRKEMLSAKLDDNGPKMTSHFVFDLDKLNQPPVRSTTKNIDVPKNRFHWESSVRLELMRKLFSEKDAFGTQGYGHLLWEGFLEWDESIKEAVTRKHIPIRWLTSVNGLLGGIGNQQFRPQSWEEYAAHVLKLRENVIICLKQLEAGLEAHFRRTKGQAILNAEVDSDAWDECKRILNNPPLLPLSAVDEWGFVSEATSKEVAQEEFDRRLMITRNGLALQRYQSYLKAFSEHTTTLSNFFFQSVDGMILQPFLGKGANREKTLDAAKEHGLNVDFARLATLNLANTVKNMRKLQTSARPLLAPFYDKSRLDRLDRIESEQIRRIWAMWFLFATHPERLIQNPSRECGAEQLGLMKKIRIRLRDALRKSSSKEVRITIASETLSWDDEVALWLTIDADQPWDIYEKLSVIVTEIQQAVMIGDPELRRYTLEFYWPYVVIIPLTRGKSIAPVAWRISLPVILQSGESSGLKWWNLAQHPIPMKAVEQLKMQVWDLPKLALAQELLQSSALLFSIAAHFRDLRRFEDLDDEGVLILQEYVNRVSSHLSDALQATLDAESAMFQEVNSLTMPDLKDRQPLLEAAEMLIELHKLIIPTEDFNNELNLRLSELIEWADRLERVPQLASICALDWTADVLNENDRGGVNSSNTEK
jgi:hypothetical protein